MIKNIIIISLVALLATSCMLPYSSYDYNQPTYYPHTYYQPTRIIVKQKPHKHHKKHKRHIKVKINKHKKTK